MRHSTLALIFHVFVFPFYAQCELSGHINQFEEPSVGLPLHPSSNQVVLMAASSYL